MNLKANTILFPIVQLAVSMVKLLDHQTKAVHKLKSGSILKGGVGSGKSITALAYYFLKECEGSEDFTFMKKPKDLYIITTAQKRDKLEWEQECSRFALSKEPGLCGVKVIVDSWNNIAKYINVSNKFFIFDEQKAVGSGLWANSFIKICKKNNWIMLSATPGDKWMDYIPLFIANGFYKNRTEFIKRHVVYNQYLKYPKVERYIDCGRLCKLRQAITVNMPFKKNTIPHEITIDVSYDKQTLNKVLNERWNVFNNCPIQNISEFGSVVRRIVNSDTTRINSLKNLLPKHPKIIVFYNYDYELDLLRKMAKEQNICCAEWNGHKHEELPKTEKWLYFVQYSAGSEGWNCTETDTMLFYSLSYSYRMTEQAKGRIDRLNTPFTDLYYYKLVSKSFIDKHILACLNNKKDFNLSNLKIYDTHFNAA